MKIEIKKVCGDKIPQWGELWCIQKYNTEPRIILVALSGLNTYNYISLHESNRWTNPKSLQELYDEVIRNNYTLTKFTGSVTLSNE